jgi:hypothetical protein
MSPADWALPFLAYGCAFCGARSGERCRTGTGAPMRPGVHLARTHNADRCPVCGTKLPDGVAPADLCPRCAVVRQLEVERLTVPRPRAEPDE